MTSENNLELTTGQKLVRGSLIAFTTLSLFALGIYWAGPGEVRAGALKWFGVYGVGGGLYPMPGSKSGEVKRVVFNGQPSMVLECNTSQRPSKVVQYYLGVFQSQAKVGKLPQAPSRRFEGRNGHWGFSHGVFRVITPRYSMLGAIDDQGRRLGLVVFAWGPRTRYYLFRGENARVVQRPGSLVSVPNQSKMIFSQETGPKESGFYLYSTRHSIKSATRNYRIKLKRDGWKEKRPRSDVYSAMSSQRMLVFHRKGMQAIASFYREKRSGKVNICLLVKPMIKQLKNKK